MNAPLHELGDSITLSAIGHHHATAEEQPHSSTALGTPHDIIHALRMADSDDEFEWDSCTARRNSPAPNQQVLSASPLKMACYRDLRAIRTFIFFDIETTGLLEGTPEKTRIPDNSNEAADQLEQIIRTTPSNKYPHIIDISMVAIERNNFLKSAAALKQRDDELSRSQSDSSREVPLLYSSHSRLISPNFSDDEWNRFETLRKSKPDIFHIGRDELAYCNSFPSEWIGFRAFLENLPKPACLVAHNGTAFDFRVLFGELQRHSLFPNALPKGLLFLDSYHSFQSIDKNFCKSLYDLTSTVDFTAYDAVSPRKAFNQADEDIFEETRLPETQVISTRTRSRVSSTAHTSAAVSRIEVRRQLFTSKIRATTTTPEPKISDDHPLLFLKAEDWSPAKRSRVHPDFFIHNSDMSKWEFDRFAALEKTRMRGSYKLCNLYKQIIKSTYMAHSAEPDCKALALVCAAYGRDFVDHADTMAAVLPFS